MPLFRGDPNGRPILSIPVSRNERIIYAFCWLALAVSLVVSLLALVYLPDGLVVNHTPDGLQVYTVSDKYALLLLSFPVLCTAIFVYFLPQYPLHRSTYLVKITVQNAETQYRFGRFLSACFITSLGWWFTVAQIVLFTIWHTGRENDVLLNSALLVMTGLSVSILLYSIIGSFMRR